MTEILFARLDEIITLTGTPGGDLHGTYQTPFLNTVNGNVGTFGSATQSVQFTVNAKGLITAAANAAITASAGTLTGTALATNVVTSSLTALGTIATGIWQGTKVGLAYGGSNADLSATGGANQFVKQTSSGGALSVAAILAADLPLATNAAIGGMRGDTTTISCIAGVCTAVGAAATSIDAGGSTTSISNGVTNNLLYDLGGFVKVLATANSSVLVTNGSGAPAWATSLSLGGTLAVTGASTLTGGVTTNGARSVFQAGSETYAIGLRYVSSDGVVYLGATHSATPDFILSNNAGTQILKVADAGNAILGVGGTGADTSSILINGGSAAAGGAAILFEKNASASWRLGHESAITGSGTSSDLIFWSSSIMGRFKVSDGALALSSTTASTSPTTGGLLAAGGIGAVGDINWGGAAWTNYTPTVACGVGTVTTATNTGAYKMLGKTLVFRARFLVTTIGTCTGNFTITLPNSLVSAGPMPIAAYNSVGTNPAANIDTGATTVFVNAVPTNGNYINIGGAVEVN